MNNKKIDAVTKSLQLPFEIFSIDAIESRLKDLNGKENSISKFYRIDEATKSKIRKIEFDSSKNVRFFSYIKFFEFSGIKYGLVGGKTTFTSPDLDFSLEYGNSKTSFARKFLSYNDLHWDDTIILIEHKATSDKKSDEEMALFIECFLQREFNLFNS